MDNVNAYLAWLRSLCEKAELSQADLARECHVTQSVINRLFKGQQFGCLHEVLSVLIRAGASTTEEEVEAKLKLIAHALKGQRGGTQRMKRIREKVASAFASRPAPEKKVENRQLSQEETQEC